MTGVDAVTLGVEDVVAAEKFYADAFGLGDLVGVRETDEPTSGFRGFTLSLVVAQPGDVDALVESALLAGATSLKPVTKSFWGYGGVVQAPDGAVWKVASSAKKDSGPVTRTVDEVVLLLGCSDVKATKQHYVERGLPVGKSFGGKYVELGSPGSPVKLALYGRRALAKDAGVPPEGSGSHRLTIHGRAGTFTDPDAFEWVAGSA